MNQTRKLNDLPAWKHWPAERLIKESQMNPRAFERGFQMRAFNDSERMFPSFKQCWQAGVVVGEVARRGYPTFIGVDLAGPKRPGNVIFAIALDPGTQRRYPVEIHNGAWTSPETARKIAEVAGRHNVPAGGIMVENNGYQQAILDWIRNSPGDHSFWYKIEAFTTGTQKNAPSVGLPSLEVEFFNKAWCIAQGEWEGHPVTCACGWCCWVAEMKDHPMAATNDHVMACWFAREAISRWNGLGGPRTPISNSSFNTR